ncbi:unnamed protein product [Brassica rapa subsp. trilocularis]
MRKPRNKKKSKIREDDSPPQNEIGGIFRVCFFMRLTPRADYHPPVISGLD